MHIPYIYGNKHFVPKPTRRLASSALQEQHTCMHTTYRLAHHAVHAVTRVTGRRDFIIITSNWCFPGAPRSPPTTHE
jgi:hypothetical protein